MKMNNYLWVVVYIVAGAYLLKDKDEFWYGFVSKRFYIGLWVMWVLGFTCTLIGLIGGI